MTVLNEVVSLLMRAESLGYERLADGTRLIGRVPHVAPEAWLHIIGWPLTAEEIRRLEADVGRPIVPAFRELMLEANGLSMFSDSISIFGLRTSYKRDVSDAFQPYSLRTPNVEERPSDAPAGVLFIGSYNWDGSLLYVAVDGSVHRCDRDSAVSLNRWPSLAEMLARETERISGLFDSTGRRLDSRAPTTP